MSEKMSKEIKVWGVGVRSLKRFIILVRWKNVSSTSGVHAKHTTRTFSLFHSAGRFVGKN